jgi:hypothetical protein
MKRFITNTKKIRLFYKIFLQYYKNPTPDFDEKLGASVRHLFEDEGVDKKWKKFYPTLTFDEREILELISNGYKIYYYGGKWSFETGKKVTNRDLEQKFPYSVGCLYPEVGHVSTDAINSLRKKGMIDL